MKKWVLFALVGLGIFTLGRFSATDSPLSAGSEDPSVQTPDGRHPGGWLRHNGRTYQ